MPSTVHIRGEGGVIFEMTLPLHESIEERLIKGAVRRVNPDGTEFHGEDTIAAPPRTKPAVNAPKSEWVAWAVTRGVALDDAEAATKQDLIDLHGG